MLSQFLRLAAYRREESQEPESDESQAIEGVLLAIYSGDENAVSAMQRLIEGSGEQIVSVPGDRLQTTCMCNAKQKGATLELLLTRNRCHC